jgi:hypothetical protein
MKFRTIVVTLAACLVVAALVPVMTNQLGASSGAALAKDNGKGGKVHKQKKDKENRGKNPKAKGRHDNGWHRGQNKEKREDVQIVTLNDPVTVNTPEILTPTAQALPTTTAPTPVPTGLIAVRVMRCQAGTPATGTDWQTSCQTAVESAQLQLDGITGPYTGWQRLVSSGPGGLAHFDTLPAGRYRLDLVGADWCHAESDSVDIDGNLVVGTGETVTVWTFVCQP